MADYLKKIEALIDIRKEGAETTVEGTDAKVVLKDEHFLANLPEGVTEELVKKYEGYKVDYTNASTHVTGTLGNEAFAKYPEVTRVTSRHSLYDGQHFEVIGQRETGEGKNKRYGDYAVVVESQISDHGTMGKILKHLSTEAKASIGQNSDK